jgi:hypothetical protein
MENTINARHRRVCQAPPSCLFAVWRPSRSLRNTTLAGAAQVLGHVSLSWMLQGLIPGERLSLLTVHFGEDASIPGGAMGWRLANGTALLVSAGQAPRALEAVLLASNPVTGGHIQQQFLAQAAVLPTCMG